MLQVTTEQNVKNNLPVASSHGSSLSCCRWPSPGSRWVHVCQPETVSGGVQHKHCLLCACVIVLLTFGNMCMSTGLCAALFNRQNSHSFLVLMLLPISHKDVHIKLFTPKK